MKTNLRARRLFRKTLILKGMMITSMREGVDYDTPANWVERAMRVAKLYRHMRQHVEHETAVEYITVSLQRRFDFNFDHQTVECLIQSGSTIRNIITWRWMRHLSLQDMLDHCTVISGLGVDSITAARYANIRYYEEYYDA